MCEYKPLYPICGDNILDSGEQCDGNTAACNASGHDGMQSCNSTCGWGSCTALPYCGDGACNGGESCSACAGDCGACASSGSGHHSGGGGSSLSTSWNCTNWSNACINGQEFRTCRLNSASRQENRTCTARSSTSTGLVTMQILPVEGKNIATIRNASFSESSSMDQALEGSSNPAEGNSITGFSVSEGNYLGGFSLWWIFLLIGMAVLITGWFMAFGKKKKRK